MASTPELDQPPADAAARAVPEPEPLLTVDGLTVRYGSAERAAVDDVSFGIRRGDRVGLVGESGSGKSTLAAAILRLLPPAAAVSGRIELDGLDLMDLKPSELRALRSTRMARVPQDPLGNLNPVFTIGRQLSDVVSAHRSIGRRERTATVEDALRRVGIGDAEVKRRSYPHELSGGMRQRVMIAMALLNHPDLLIADEPTTALDVTVQAQVVELLRERVAGAGMTLLLISHDVGVISELCTTVMVMYGGRIVETGAASEVLTRPTHPYTRSLLRAARGRVAGHGDDPSEVVA
ncbi:ABC transporter ATP-binding protein [Peterkaempfera bronchialis]|uniref:ABC transporter ATP-binding protein n=1 Tax=Peterkaempfera bronchialis TaxID=2126346 RepID=A0A345T4L6_9ACTN|nr:ABC transporter ATP-binding protein [Peterkaempfera bronchialis]AXI80921.1 ABC transporter ATP-binding protein [Peterkaempfera bronchialis]